MVDQMPMPSILTAIAVLILATGAETLHAFRVRKTQHLAFGPNGKFSPLTYLAPILRVLSLTGLASSLVSLLLIEPKAHRSKMTEVEAKERRHLMLVVDVSPSMRLQDSGDNTGISRTQRAAALCRRSGLRPAWEQCARAGRPTPVDGWRVPSARSAKAR